MSPQYDHPVQSLGFVAWLLKGPLSKCVASGAEVAALIRGGSRLQKMSGRTLSSAGKVAGVM